MDQQLYTSNTFKRLALLLFLNFILSAGLTSQNRIILHVHHLFKSKRVEISTGDQIKFRLKDDPSKYRGRVDTIGDSLITISGLVVPIHSISCFYMYRANYVSSSFSKFFIRLGLGFIALDTFNNLTNGTPPILNPRSVFIGLPVALIGGIIRICGYKKYKISPGCTVWVVGP
jgi:hypothetical protein